MQEDTKKRRIWSHTLNKGSIAESRVDTCAICKELLIDYCLDCKANFVIINSYDQTNTFKDESKDVWMSLLLLQKRRILPFDMVVLKTIYIHCLPSIKIKGCEVCMISCNHIYHKDCIRKWLTKRESCPLCNIYYPLSALDNGFYILGETSDTYFKVDNVYTSSNDFISYKELQRRKDRARGFIVNILKHNKRAWTGNEISKRYKDSFDNYDIQQKLDEETFNDVLSKLIADEHVSCSTIKVYEFNA
jgi:RING-H2 zinc finger domain